MDTDKKVAESEKKEIEHIKKCLFPIIEKSKAQKVYLFGSVARGTGTRKSDIDLMIVTETQERFFDRYDDFDKIYEALPDWSVDMLIYTPEELSRISHRFFIKGIIEKGTILYERGKKSD